MTAPDHPTQGAKDMTEDQELDALLERVSAIADAKKRVSRWPTTGGNRVTTAAVSAAAKHDHETLTAAHTALTQLRKERDAAREALDRAGLDVRARP